MTPERLANKKVVRNERRQRYDNRSRQVRLWLTEALYAENHPYRVPTIGKHEDIENARMEDVQDFKKWYVPNNASLAIVGDLIPPKESPGRQVLAPFPRPQPVQVTHAPAMLTESVTLHYARAPHHKVWVAWQPQALRAGDAELDIVSGLLSEGWDSVLNSAS